MRFNNPAFTLDESPNFISLLKSESYEDDDFDNKVVEQFLTYTKQNGETLPGLVKRSIAEAMLFIDGNYLESIENPYGEEATEMYEEFLDEDDREKWIPYLRR